MFNGLGMGLGNLPLLSDAKTRSISPENFKGEKGKKWALEPENMGKVGRLGILSLTFT